MLLQIPQWLLSFSLEFILYGNGCASKLFIQIASTTFLPICSLFLSLSLPYGSLFLSLSLVTTGFWPPFVVSTFVALNHIDFYSNFASSCALHWAFITKMVVYCYRNGFWSKTQAALSDHIRKFVNTSCWKTISTEWKKKKNETYRWFDNITQVVFVVQSRFPLNFLQQFRRLSTAHCCLFI